MSGCESSRPASHRTAQAQKSTHGASCTLRVAESAVTLKKHYSAGKRSTDGDQFLASTVIENPCRLAATNASFTVSMLDGQGRELVSAGQPVEDHFTIALIMPGQR